jgi:GR25 family glycosyltransferase involved in LPS biosynthesis
MVLPNNIFYINLEHRKDRLFFSKEQSKIFPSIVERIQAVEHEDGRTGCALSHLNTLYKIYNSKKDGYYIILEDDFFFIEEIDFEDEIEKMKELKANVYCLSYTYPEKEDVGQEDYFRLIKSFSTCAYMFHSSFAPILIHNFESAIENKKPIDLSWQSLQKDFIFIAKKSPQVLQLPSYSNITDNNTLYQQHYYILIDPDRNCIATFLLQLMNGLLLSIRYKKFLFVMHWQDYNDFFIMPFYPHKQLKKEKEIIHDLDNIDIESSKNYVLGPHCNPKKRLLSNDIVESFHYLLQPAKINQSSMIQVGFIMDKTKPLQFPLTKTSYYIDCYNLILKEYKNFKLHIITNDKKNLPRLDFQQTFEIIEKDGLEMVHHCLLYDVLVLSNSDLAYWCGRINFNPGKIIYHTDMVNSHRSMGDGNIYPLEWRKQQSHNITFVIIDLHSVTEFFSIDIIQKNAPIVLYVRQSTFNQTEEKFRDLPNIKIRYLKKENCKLFRYFPDESEDNLLKSDYIECLYNVSVENTFDTDYFMVGSIENYNFLEYEEVLKVLPDLHRYKMNTFLTKNNVVEGPLYVGTSRSVLRFYQNYYSKMIKNPTFVISKENFESTYNAEMNDCSTNTGSLNFKMLLVFIFLFILLVSIPFFLP